MSCPDNAQHLLDQVDDGMPNDVLPWDKVEIVIHRCECGAYKSPNAPCKRCENLRLHFEGMGLNEDVALRMVDVAASQDEETARLQIVQALRDAGQSNGTLVKAEEILTQYKDIDQPIPPPSPTDTGSDNPASVEAEQITEDEEEAAYQAARQKFLALMGQDALDDDDNLAPGYEGLQNTPVYEQFAQARDHYRQVMGIEADPETAEGVMRDGRYTVPKRLRTSIEATGLSRSHTNTLARRFTQIGKESAARQKTRIQKKIETILQAEGITDPDAIQRVTDVMNGARNKKVGSSSGKKSTPAKTRPKRQVSEATRQKLREAAANRKRCQRCGAFMGKTECKRCARLRDALEEAGVATHRLDLVRDRIAGQTKIIEREYRQRNLTLMKQEAQTFLAEINRGDLVLDVMDVLDNQLGESPETPIAAHEVSPEQWLLLGGRPFANKDLFPDLSHLGFEWPEIDWETDDPEEAARLQHQLEAMAAWARGIELSPEAAAALPPLPDPIPTSNENVAKTKVNQINTGEAPHMIDSYTQVCRNALDDMRKYLSGESFSEATLDAALLSFATSSYVLAHASPPKDVLDNLQQDEVSNDASSSESPTAVSSGPGLMNCPNCGRFANAETGCQHCNITPDEYAMLETHDVMQQPGYRVPTGYKVTETAAEVVAHEMDELGNDIHVSDEMRAYLERHGVPGSSLIWITAKPEDAKRYASDGDTVQEISFPPNSIIIGKDGDGGYLVLKGAEPVADESETSEAVTQAQQETDSFGPDTTKLDYKARAWVLLALAGPPAEDVANRFGWTTQEASDIAALVRSGNAVADDIAQEVYDFVNERNLGFIDRCPDCGQFTSEKYPHTCPGGDIFYTDEMLARGENLPGYRTQIIEPEPDIAIPSESIIETDDEGREPVREETPSPAPSATDTADTPKPHTRYEVSYKDNWTWVSFPDAGGISKEEREKQYRTIFDEMKTQYRFRYSRKRKAWYAKRKIDEATIAEFIAASEPPAVSQDTAPLAPISDASTQPVPQSPPVSDDDDDFFATAGPRATKTLNRVMTFGSMGTMTRKDAVKNRVAAGWVVVNAPDGKRRLQDMSSGIFYDQDTLTKSGMDYAEYLIAAGHSPQIERDENDIWRCAKCKSFVSPRNPHCKRCERYDEKLAPYIARGIITQKEADELRTLVGEYATDHESEDFDLIDTLKYVNQFLIEKGMSVQDRYEIVYETLILAEPEGAYESRVALREAGWGESDITRVLTDLNDGLLDKVANGSLKYRPDALAAIQQYYQKTRPNWWKLASGVHEGVAAFANDNFPDQWLYRQLRNAGYSIGDVMAYFNDKPSQVDPDHPMISLAEGLKFGRIVTGDVEYNQALFQTLLQNGYNNANDAVKTWAALNSYLSNPDNDPYFIPDHIITGDAPDAVLDAAYDYANQVMEYQAQQAQQAPDGASPATLVDGKGQMRCATCYAFVSPDNPHCTRCESLEAKLSNLVQDMPPEAQALLPQLIETAKHAITDVVEQELVDLYDQMETLGVPVEDTNQITQEIIVYVQSAQGSIKDYESAQTTTDSGTTAGPDVGGHRGVPQSVSRPDAGESEGTLAGISPEDVSGVGGNGEVGNGRSDSNRVDEGSSPDHSVAGTGNAMGSVPTDEGGMGVPAQRGGTPGTGQSTAGMGDAGGGRWRVVQWSDLGDNLSAETALDGAADTAVAEQDNAAEPDATPLPRKRCDQCHGTFVSQENPTCPRCQTLRDTVAQYTGEYPGSQEDQQRIIELVYRAIDDPDASLEIDNIHPELQDYITQFVTDSRVSVAETSDLEKDDADENKESAKDYRIDPAEIGIGSLKVKARQNIEAIRLLKQLEEEDRDPTPEEQAILVKYVGWGGLQGCFDPYQISTWNTNAKWADEYRGLKELLTDEEWAAAKATVNDAFYTPPEVITAMWDALREMGYTGGNVLEPAAGVGHFFGLMPDDVRDNSNRIAIEIDSVSARIAKKLYPESNVRHSPYEKTNLPDNYFDIVVGNVPFGQVGVNDPSFTGHEEKLTNRIHNYFFAKAMKQVKPGGIVAFVTSRYTMDSPKHQHVREWLAAQADLVGAVRLPNSTFKKNANTEVTTDIIFLRKRAPGDEPGDNSWVGTTEIAVPNKYGHDTNIRINEYFADRPEMMMGEIRAVGSRYNDAQPELIADDSRPLSDSLAEAVQRLPKSIAPGTHGRCHCGAFLAESGVCNNPRCNSNRDIYRLASADIAATNLNGEFLVDDRGVLCRYDKKTQSLIPVDYALKKDGTPPIKIVRAMDALPVKEAAKKLLDLNVAHASDDELAQAQAELAAAYDAFVKKHGPLHKKGNLQALRDDPHLPFLLSLENYDSDKGIAVKTDIFTKRVINLTSRPEKADNAEDALMIAIFEGGVNWQRMNELTGIPISELQEELTNAGYVFKKPDGSWELAEEYLSGDVRQKLQEAQAAAQLDPEFERNVDALLAVQPAPVSFDEISVGFGANWIPPEDMQNFIKHLLYVDVPVTYVPESAKWYLDLTDNYTKKRLRYSTANTTTWGVPGKPAIQLIEDALNQKDTTIKKDGPDGKRVSDQQATLAAREMQDKIRAEFKKWIEDDPLRTRRLTDIYNEKYNRIVPRTYTHPFSDDPNFMFFGQNPESFRLRHYQKNTVWRTLQGNTTYLAHIVGAGKSASMIASSMELKRLGIRQKPIHVMPKHTLDQYAADFKNLYPGAKVLLVGSEDMTPAKRAETLARIATEDWDAVLISHKSFEKIKVSKDVEASFIKQQIQQYEDRILAASGDDDSYSYGYSRSKKKPPSVKNLEARKRRLKEKLNRVLAQANEKDSGLSFEQLGIDHIFMDEAHVAKKLEFATTRTNVSGLSPQGSDVAFNLYMKTKYLQNRCKCGRFVDKSGYCSHCAHKTEVAPGGFTFASGTPITNTLAEVYTLLRFLNEDELDSLGFGSFDAWAAQFTEMVTELEMKPSGGGYRSATRMSKFKNAPELLRILNQYVDWQMNPDEMGLERPLLAGDDSLRPAYEVARDKFLQFAGSKALTDKDKLAEGFEHFAETKEWVEFEEVRDAYRKPISVSVPLSQAQKDFIMECEWRVDHMPKDTSDDNMLLVVNDARKASLDYRLIDPEAPDDPNSKINQAVANMLDIYTQHPGQAQMVFLDMGVPTNRPDKKQEFVEAVQNSLEKNGQSLDDVDVDQLTQVALNSLRTHHTAPGYSRKTSLIPDEVAQDIKQELLAQGLPLAKAENVKLDILNALDVYKGIPSTFDLYGDMKKKLIAGGIPENEIAFIHDAKTDAQKLELFQKVNKSEVRFLFGSTGKMGTGVNAQEKLIALHHIDAPWRPDEVEQREGRILRYGNQNEEIKIFRYATEQSFDVYMWQTLERKAKFIEQIRSGRMDIREMDDAAGAVIPGYAEMKAVATGDPSVLELVQVEQDLAKYESLERAHKMKVRGIRTKLAQLPKEIAAIQKSIDRKKVMLDAMNVPKQPEIIIDGQTFKGDGYTLKAGELLEDMIAKARADARKNGDDFFTLAGKVEVYGLPVTIHGGTASGRGNKASAIIQAGDHEEVVKFGAKGQTNIARLTRRHTTIARSVESDLANIAGKKEHIPALEAELGTSFEYEQKIADLRQKKEELETRVGKIAAGETKQFVDDVDVEDDNFGEVMAEAEAAFG